MSRLRHAEPEVTSHSGQIQKQIPGVKKKVQWAGVEGEVTLTLRNEVYFLEEGRYKVVVRWSLGLLMKALLDASPGTAEPSAETPARWHTP